jgi:dUTP pyrophosphatase
MLVKIKKLHPEAVIPSYAKPGDAGLDLTAVGVLERSDTLECYTGLAFEIPEGHVGLIFPRSSISKTNLSLSNAVGVIDSQYRGEVVFKFNKVKSNGKSYEPGDRVGQLIIMPFPKVSFLEVNSLEETERGSGGFGSTGT